MQRHAPGRDSHSSATALIDAASAHQLLEAGSLTGKIVLLTGQNERAQVARLSITRKL